MNIKHFIIFYNKQNNMQSFDLMKFVETLTSNIYIKIHKTVFYVSNNSELKNSVHVLLLNKRVPNLWKLLFIVLGYTKIQ